MSEEEKNVRNFLHGKHMKPKSPEECVKELKLQLLASQSETKQWKNGHTDLLKQKNEQFSKIESKLYILESTLMREKKEIEKRLKDNDEIMNDQREKIDKLTSANKKLLNGLMTLRYEKPKLAAQHRSHTIDETVSTPNSSDEYKAPSPERLQRRKHSVDSSEVLIANRARILAQSIQKRKMERRNRTISHTVIVDHVMEDYKPRSTRSNSLTVGLLRPPH